jgi:hypothetical protein
MQTERRRETDTMNERQRADVLNDPTIEACPRCGMARDVWPDDSAGGAVKDGITYCCKGCAEDTGCTCTGNRTQEPAGRAPTADEIRYDKASGDFLNRHRVENKTIEAHEYGDSNVEKSTGPTAGVIRSIRLCWRRVTRASVDQKTASVIGASR